MPAAVAHDSVTRPEWDGPAEEIADTHPGPAGRVLDHDCAAGGLWLSPAAPLDLADVLAAAGRFWHYRRERDAEDGRARVPGGEAVPFGMFAAHASEVVPPGAALAGCLEAGDPLAQDDATLVTAITGWRRLTSWAQAGELAAVAELSRRRGVTGGPDGIDPIVSAADYSAADCSAADCSAADCSAPGRPVLDCPAASSPAASPSADSPAADCPAANDTAPCDVSVIDTTANHAPPCDVSVTDTTASDPQTPPTEAPTCESGAPAPDIGAGAGSPDPAARRRELDSAFAADEIALALTLTRAGAEFWADLAVSLARRLPATLVALGEGRIDLGRAKLIVTWTCNLDPDLASKVEARVLPGAGGKTSGQLRAALQRAVLSVDPRAAERRRVEREKDARVELAGDDDGTASLGGRFLPVAQAAAAWARISALAKAYAAAGAGGGMDLLRAQVFTGLLLGTLPLIPPSGDGSGNGPRPGPPGGSTPPAGPVSPGGPGPSRGGADVDPGGRPTGGPESTVDGGADGGPWDGLPDPRDEDYPGDADASEADQAGAHRTAGRGETCPQPRDLRETSAGRDPDLSQGHPDHPPRDPDHPPRDPDHPPRDPGHPQGHPDAHCPGDRPAPPWPRIPIPGDEVTPGCAHGWPDAVAAAGGGPGTRRTGLALTVSWRTLLGTSGEPGRLSRPRPQQQVACDHH